jgi:hypothetical protein
VLLALGVLTSGFTGQSKNIKLERRSQLKYLNAAQNAATA